MRVYLKRYIWEYIACVAVCTALLVNLAQGFYIPDSMADSILLAAGVCAVLLLVFYIISYNRIAMIAGLSGSAAVVILAFVIMRLRGVDIVDEEGSSSAYLIYWFIFAVTCIAVFALSTFRIGVIILFIIGTVLNASMEYLEFERRIWLSVIFILGCIVLFLLRQFRCSALNSSSKEPAFGRFALTAAALAAAAALIGAGIYYAFIKPADPPTVKIEFFEQYKIYDILEVLGITDDYSLPDEDEKSDEQEDDRLDNSDENEEDESESMPEEPDMPDVPQNGDNYNEKEQGVTDLTTIAWHLTKPALIILIIIGVLLLFGLPPLIKYLLRKRRMKKIEAMDSMSQIRELFDFYMKKFKRLGWARKKSETPAEYAARSSAELNRYMAGTCSVSQIADTFSDARYGGIEPSFETLSSIREAYPQLLKNCRKQLGFVRYALKYYFL